jgi:hypothetical protein
MLSDAERITALEVEVENLKELVTSGNEKLDELLSLRNKGIGAFWLASGILGTGIIGFITAAIDWIK